MTQAAEEKLQPVVMMVYGRQVENVKLGDYLTPHTCVRAHTHKFQNNERLNVKSRTIKL